MCLEYDRLLELGVFRVKDDIEDIYKGKYSYRKINPSRYFDVYNRLIIGTMPTDEENISHTDDEIQLLKNENEELKSKVNNLLINIETKLVIEKENDELKSKIEELEKLLSLKNNTEEIKIEKNIKLEITKISSIEKPKDDVIETKNELVVEIEKPKENKKMFRHIVYIKNILIIL